MPAFFWATPRQMVLLFTGTSQKIHQLFNKKHQHFAPSDSLNLLLQDPQLAVPPLLHPLSQVWGRTSAKAGNLVPFVLPALLALLGGALGRWAGGNNQSSVSSPPLGLARGTAVSVWACRKAAEAKGRTGQGAETLVTCSGADTAHVESRASPW